MKASPPTIRRSSYTACVLVAQSCPTLCDLMDCSPPGSSVHEILQGGILEWTAISYTAYPAYNRRGSQKVQQRPRLKYPYSRWNEESQIRAWSARARPKTKPRAEPKASEKVAGTRPLGPGQGRARETRKF